MKNAPLFISIFIHSGLLSFVLQAQTNRKTTVYTNERNNKGFEIERKFESGNWLKVGFINGNGTTLETTYYHYTDNLKNISYKGIISYRLRQVDFNALLINRGITSGVYFYRINAVDKVTGNNFSSIKKMILLK
jgi:hypothetical protein